MSKPLVANLDTAEGTSYNFAKHPMSRDILVMFVSAYKSSNILAHFLAVRCCLAVVGMLLLATGVDLLDK